jgi:hypothetical protein
VRRGRGGGAVQRNLVQEDLHEPVRRRRINGSGIGFVLRRHEIFQSLVKIKNNRLTSCQYTRSYYGVSSHLISCHTFSGESRSMDEEIVDDWKHLD